MALNQENRFGGDCEQDLQVGGPGEEILPRRVQIVLDEIESASFLNLIRHMEGDFKQKMTNSI